jgi:hypothetical protein
VGAHYKKKCFILMMEKMVIGVHFNMDFVFVDVT